ncbi:hypothetical protein ACFE04_001953 [Oxalis oulophora]
MSKAEVGIRARSAGSRSWRGRTGARSGRGRTGLRSRSRYVELTIADQNNCSAATRKSNYFIVGTRPAAETKDISRGTIWLSRGESTSNWSSLTADRMKSNQKSKLWHIHQHQRRFTAIPGTSIVCEADHRGE